MNYLNTKNLAPLCLLWLICFSWPGESVWAQESGKKLRWKFEQGDKYDVELTQQTGIKTAIQNRSQEIGNEMLLSMKWTISKANDSDYVIDQSIERIKLTITAPSKGAVEITKIDTASTDKPTEFGERLLEQVRPLIGSVFSVAMTDRGEITNVEIPKPTMEALRAAPASMQLRELITEQGLKDLFGQSAIVFPEAAIESGATWNTSNSVKNELATVTKKSTFTYNGTEEADGLNFDSFSIDAEIESSEVSAENSIDNFTGSGKIKFANNATTMLDSRISNAMTTMRKYRDQKIKTTVNTDVSMRVTKSDD